MFEGFTDSACRVVVRAQQEARRLGDDTALPGHLLLGITTLDSPVSSALHGLGISAVQLHPHLHESATPHPHAEPLAATTKDALRRARVEATIRHHTRIRTGHVLLATIRSPDVDDLIRSLRADPAQIKLAVIPRLQLHEN